MAKRKRQLGGGSKIKPVVTYEEDKFALYIRAVESQILAAWDTRPDLRDGEVREALTTVFKEIERTETLPEQLLTDSALPEKSEETSTDLTEIGSVAYLQEHILIGLQSSFEDEGPLNPQDTVGILKRVNYSIGTWNKGMELQGYLHYIKGFLEEGKIL